MTLSIRVNGENFENFQSARAMRSIDMLCGSFSFTATADNSERLPIKTGDKAEVLADGYLFLTGYVENTPVSYNANSHSMNITGRSVLQDLVDSSVGYTKEFTAGVNLVSIIRRVLNDLKLNKVKIINEAGTIKNFSSTEIASSEIGQNAFEFIELFARKRQVLLTESSDGNLKLVRASTEKLPINLKMVQGSTGNNILSATFSNDISKRYYKYTVQSQLNPLLFDTGTTPEDLSNQSATLYDTYMRKSRNIEINCEESIESYTAKDRAKWEANIREARSFNYAPVIQGHSYDSGVWVPNRLISVKDDFADINAELLIKSVELTYSLDSGSLTYLTCARKNAFTLQVEQNQRDASRSKTGDDFF